MMKVTQNFLAVIIRSSVIPNPGLWSRVVSCFWNNLSQYSSFPLFLIFSRTKRDIFTLPKGLFQPWRSEDVWLCLCRTSPGSLPYWALCSLEWFHHPPGQDLGVGSMDRRREDSAYFSRTAFLVFFFFQWSPQLNGNVEQEIVQI